MQSIGSQQKSDSVIVKKKTKIKKILDLIQEISFECKGKNKLQVTDQGTSKNSKERLNKRG